MFKFENAIKQKQFEIEYYIIYMAGLTILECIHICVHPFVELKQKINKNK